MKNDFVAVATAVLIGLSAVTSAAKGSAPYARVVSGELTVEHFLPENATPSLMTIPIQGRLKLSGSGFQDESAKISGWVNVLAGGDGAPIAGRRDLGVKARLSSADRPPVKLAEGVTDSVVKVLQNGRRLLITIHARVPIDEALAHADQTDKLDAELARSRDANGVVFRLYLFENIRPQAGSYALPVLHPSTDAFPDFPFPPRIFVPVGQPE